MILNELRQQVCRANIDLSRAGLAPLTWGNASGRDRAQELVAIKPSGVPYDALTPETIVVVDLAGRIVEGQLKPSSDLPAHLELYRSWPDVGGVVHTHSAHATMFAQACRPIPCFGTTHADHFCGEVPVTRLLTEDEVRNDYEAATGRIIAERLAGLDAGAMPAALAACHGPFAWGRTVSEAVHNAIALEQVAMMALGTLRLNSDTPPLPQYLLDKHYQRKHGSGAYYGQDTPRRA